jgi:hypothetical protein
MPVLAKSCGIVIRMLIDRTFGTHFHAFYGDSELVIGLNPMRVIQGDVPPWVQEWALEWVNYHQSEFLSAWNLDLNLATPISRQAAKHLAFETIPVPSLICTHSWPKTM